MFPFGRKSRAARERRFWPEHDGETSPKTYYEFDPGFHRRYEAAIAATNVRGDRPLRRLRFFSIERAAQQVRNVPGDACEVGCFRGLSAYIAAAAFRASGKTLTFHICDSFEGLSEPTAGDAALPGEPPTVIKAGNYSCSEIEVRQHLAEFDFVEYHKGWLPRPFEALENKRFCYAHIDVDLAEPTRMAVEFLWPRINPGGIIVFDDYGMMSYPGARRAIDGYFRGRGDVFFIDQPAGNGLAVKVRA